MVTPLMEALRGKDYAARGFAAGLAAHGIGTARAFTLDTLVCTFAGIALGLNAVVTAGLAGWCWDGFEGTPVEGRPRP